MKMTDLKLRFPEPHSTVYRVAETTRLFIQQNEKVTAALELAYKYGGIDGAHHKMWVIDQMVRALLGSEEAYRLWVADHCQGEDGPNTYEWDEGIAP